jgi:hypothetical protein
MAIRNSFALSFALLSSCLNDEPEASDGWAGPGRLSTGRVWVGCASGARNEPESGGVGRCEDGLGACVKSQIGDGREEGSR